MSTHVRKKSYGALLFLDLDNFKPLNDKHGHSVGDLLLAQVASRLIACVRRVDTVARFGGDEFVVLMTDVTNDESLAKAYAQSVAEKIRLSLAMPYEISVVQGKEQKTVTHTCSASIGGLVFGDESDSTDELLQKADSAMYRAKESGRNRICF